MESGIRCVIAPSVGDVDMASIQRIAAALEQSNAGEMTVELVNSKLLIAGQEAIPFELPDDRRALLLDGLDQVSFILASADDTDELEANNVSSRPWVYASPA